MAHETLSAQAWFDRERLRLERLVYMPLPLAPRSHNNGEPTFLYRAETPAQEQELLDMEEELEDDEDYLDSNEVESEDEDDAASYEEERDGTVAAEEWQELAADNRSKFKDPTGDLAHSVRETIGGKFQPSLAAIPRQPTQPEEVARRVAVCGQFNYAFASAC